METKTVAHFKNIQTIDLQTKIERKGKTNFKRSVIKSSGSILASHILNYMKKGGDITNLTPENVFKKL